VQVHTQLTFSIGLLFFNRAEIKSIAQHAAAKRYRELQTVVLMINHAFRYYLEYFPSVLLGIVALLMYGSIRLWHIDPISYSSFPSCLIRCLFESMTPLCISGDVNQESSEILVKWKQDLAENAKFEDRNTDLAKSETEEAQSQLEDSDERICIDEDITAMVNENQDKKWLMIFQTSCSNIKCTAGSLYTFENSIVAVTMHNCAQLTLNILLLYK